jgi:hypothetical protein
VRSRRETSSWVPSQPATSGEAARASRSHITCTSPLRATVSTIAAASSSATARNSESLSRKWWKIAPRDSPVSSSSRRTVAPSYP